eukprot:SAG31_NODE_14089_length_828_cov_0.843621_1_plen_43_part_10
MLDGIRVPLVVDEVRNRSLLLLRRVVPRFRAEKAFPRFILCRG